MMKGIIYLVSNRRSTIDARILDQGASGTIGIPIERRVPDGLADKG
jgi:hypothetical protein